MVYTVKPAGRLYGQISVPGDKSVSHRAAILGALACGETYVENFLACGDCLATLHCLRALGVRIQGPEEGVVRIYGQGPDSLAEPEIVLNACNSGTTMRLLAGVLAGQPFFSVLSGDDSLHRRPMSRIIEPLTRMGANISGRRGSLAPLAIRGENPLRPIFHRSLTASAQVKSAVLLAGLRAHGVTTVEEPALSRDHTERMLQIFGARVERSGRKVSVEGHPDLFGQHIRVPGDISSAAFFLVAASILPGSDLTITGVGLNPTRTGILDALSLMGAKITTSGIKEVSGEPVGNIHIKNGTLRGATFGKEMIPRLIDEIPALAVAAACAEGETVFRDAAELKVKETDRSRTVVEALTQMGVSCQATPDGLQISGPTKLAGAVINSYGDHRLGMAMTVAGLAARGETRIMDAGCMAVSFPGFTGLLDSIRED